MFNTRKNQRSFPKFMCISDITSIAKNNLSRHDLENDRGISLITVYKKVFENLLYNDLAADIDFNMSESNIGFRKRRNFKGHLVMIHGIVNDAVKNKGKCIQ